MKLSYTPAFRNSGLNKVRQPAIMIAYYSCIHGNKPRGLRAAVSVDECNIRGTRCTTTNTGVCGSAIENSLFPSVDAMP
jgi:hypothetical protein